MHLRRAANYSAQWGGRFCTKIGVERQLFIQSPTEDGEVPS